MNILPAKVAGVQRIVMMTPTPGGEVNPVVMAAAHIGGGDEIWRVGGAQAIEALGHGTNSVEPVVLDTGPRHEWVGGERRTHCWDRTTRGAGTRGVSGGEFC